jgi:lipid-A-disaccharide synthase-like uncharacterized protein
MRYAVLSLALLVAVVLPAAAEEPSKPLVLKQRVVGVERVELVPEADGSYRYQVHFRDGHLERLSPDQFSELLYTGHLRHAGFFRFLNISSPVGLAWVALGLLGQLLFTGRMLVQWLASERSKRSVIPVVFWWLSLAGASMLAVYFIWRKDAVGFLGQATGWVVYVRNLWLIRKEGGRSVG